LFYKNNKLYSKIGMASPNTGRTNVQATPTIGSISPGKIGSFFTGTPIVIFLSLITLGLYVASLITTSKFLGSKDDWNVIQPQITLVLILSMIGTIIFTIAALLYFIKNPDKAVYFGVVVSCISLGMAYSAISISAISKVSR
jgi:hypothetical protein